MKQEQWIKSMDAYVHYVSLEPDGYMGWNNLAQSYIKLQQKRQAHKCLMNALRCEYENWHMWENFMIVSTDLLHYSDAIRSYNR